jgi:hypothetical protein
VSKLPASPVRALTAPAAPLQAVDAADALSAAEEKGACCDGKWLNAPAELARALAYLALMTSEAVDPAGRASSSPSLDGRRFRALTSSSRGQVSGETEFAFSQDGPIVQARYGRAIRLGFLLGLAAGDTIEFRYVRVDSDGSISSGHSVDTRRWPMCRA